jgi:hypothetical protein
MHTGQRADKLLGARTGAGHGAPPGAPAELVNTGRVSHRAVGVPHAVYASTPELLGGNDLAER